MTTQPPDEALHFRGETLTPESPRPLHAAEPGNIPVLENQMDPVFNDTSTYETTRSSQEKDNHMYNGERQPSNEAYASNGSRVKAEEGNWNLVQDQTPGSFYSQSFQKAGSVAANDTNISSSNQPASPNANPPDTETSAIRNAAQNAPLTSSLQDDQATLKAKTIPKDSSHAASKTPDVVPTPSQGPSVADVVDTTVPASETLPERKNRLESQEREDNNSDDGGVDFENLLDNLSRAPTTTVSSAPATAADDAHSHEPQATGDDASYRTPSGLPPHPEPQEQPSINSNYSPSDEFAAQYSNEHSNNNSDQGPSSLAATGAPGTSSGTSSLPPPPIASFQQTQATPTGVSREAPEKGNQKRTRAERRQSSKADDDAPWGPDVQKKYDEFLHDERIYVTEGLWDRFPFGSRLFVGQYISRCRCRFGLS